VTVFSLAGEIADEAVPSKLVSAAAAAPRQICQPVKTSGGGLPTGG